MLLPGNSNKGDKNLRASNSQTHRLQFRCNSFENKKRWKFQWVRSYTKIRFFQWARSSTKILLILVSNINSCHEAWKKYPTAKFASWKCSDDRVEIISLRQFRCKGFIYCQYESMALRRPPVLEYFTLNVWTKPVQFTLGNLRSDDGNCEENVALKLDFALSCLLRLLHIVHVVQNRRSALSLAWHEWFSCKGKEWKIYCCELPLSWEPQIWKFPVVVWQTTSKHCTKKRAARAARLFFFIQPIKSLTCGVVVDVAVVKS